jgi:hypothetical protein
MSTANPHSPANIVPADYEFAFPYAYETTVEGWPIPSYNLDMVVALRQQGKLWSPRSTCHSCGTRFIEGAAFLHVPSGQYILVGHTCADKMELLFDESAFQLLHNRRASARKLALIKAERRRALREWARGTTKEVRKAMKAQHPIVRDIRRKLIQWHSLSPKQEALVLKIHRDAEAKKQRISQQTLVAVPSGDKRVDLEGRILTVRVEDGYDRQLSYKMLFMVGEEETGCYKLWGTIPSPILEAVGYRSKELIGLRAQFSAKVSPSDKDESFGFYQRPTKAKLLDTTVTCKCCGVTIERSDSDFPYKWVADNAMCGVCFDNNRN